MRLALWLMARGIPNTAMDGCSGFSPDHHTASIIPFLDKMVNTILSRDIHRAPPLAERNSIDYIFSGYAAGRICGLIKRSNRFIWKLVNQYSVGLRAVTVKAIRAEGGIHTQTVTAKKLQQPYTGPLQPFFRNKKPQAPYLQTLVFLPHLSSSSDLRIVSSVQPSQGNPQWPAFAKHKTFSHTAAVPSGILTRLSILLRGCYRFRRHSNGIFTCTVSIHDWSVKVNRKKKRPK